MQKHFLYLLIIYFLCAFSLHAQPSIQWEKSFGSTNWGLDQAQFSNDIEKTLDGGYVIVGSNSGPNAGADYEVIKIDSSGNQVWQHFFGGSGSDIPASIKQMSDSSFVIAGYSSSANGMVTGHHGLASSPDFWIIRIDKNGILIWQKSYGGSEYDVAQSLDLTADGRILVTGFTRSSDGDVTGIHNPPQNDIWVICLDSIGNMLWEKTCGGSIADFGNCVAATDDGGCIVAGESNSNDGDVTGNHGNGDYWIVKLDATGTIQWQKSLGGTSRDFALYIIQTSDGGFITCGASRSNNGDVSFNHGLFDFWVVKMTNLGAIQWEKTYGGSFDEDGAPSLNIFLKNAIKQTSDGGYVVCGYSKSNNGDVSNKIGGTTVPDYWVIKINSLGTLIWDKSLGGTYIDHATDIEITNDNGFIITGSTYSTDVDVTNSYGNYDSWVVKLSCNPPVIVSTFPTSGVICQNDSINFICNVENYDSLVWLENGIPFSRDENPSFTFNSANTYTISLVAFTGNCSNPNSPLTDTAYSIIIVKSLPILSLSGLPPSCCINSPPINITGSPSGGSYSGSGIFGNTFDPDNSGIGTHSIIYSLTDTNGCVGSTIQSVTVNSLPLVGITGLSSNYCSNTSSINLVGAPPGGIFSGNGISGNSFNPAFMNQGIDSIKYTYTDINGCSNHIVQTVNINTIPSVYFSGLASNYCANSTSVNLIGNPLGGVFSGNGILGDIFNQTHAGAGTHPIIYTYTDGNGCSNSDTQQVIINPFPIVSLTGLTDNYCIDEPPDTIIGSPLGGIFIGSGIIGNSFNPSIANIGSHNITYNYTDSNGCSNSISKTTNVVPLPMASIAGIATICSGETETLIASGVGIFLWNTGDTSNMITIVPSNTTTYILTSSNFCGNSVDSITVYVNPLPVIAISSDTTILLGNSINIDAVGGATYLWFPTSGLSCANCSSPTATPQSTTEYSVTVSDTNGCFLTMTTIITVKDDFEIFIPDVFSPNGDGENDILYVRGTGIKEFNFVVYDRLGEKIFESNSLSLGWDGTYKGSPLNSAVFIYYLSATLFNDKKIKTKGDITLIR